MAPCVVSTRMCVSAVLPATLLVVLYTAGVFLQSVLLSDAARSLVYMALVRIYFLVYALRFSLSQSCFARSLQVFAPYCSRLLDISAQHLSPLFSFLADDVALLRHSALNIASFLGIHVSFSLDVRLVVDTCYYILRSRELSKLPRHIGRLSIHTTRAAISGIYQPASSMIHSSTFRYTALVLLLLFSLVTLYMLDTLCKHGVINDSDDHKLRVFHSIRRRLALLKDMLLSLQARCFAFLRTHCLVLAVLLGPILAADQLSWNYWHRSRCGPLARTYLPSTLKWLYCYPNEPTYRLLWHRLLRYAINGGCVGALTILYRCCIAIAYVAVLAYTWDIWALFLTPQPPAAPAEPWLPRDHKLSPEFDAVFELCGELGRGGNGFVMEARRRSDGRHFAVKFLTQVSARNWREHSSMGYAPREVVLALDLCHEHIIKSVAAFGDTTYVYFVQELFGDVWEVEGRPAGRTLSEYLLKHGPIPFDDACKIFAQLTSAVAYLHSRGIAHCDIKPANILIDRDANIRLIDFGNVIDELDDPLNPHGGRTTHPKYYAGTRVWSPPETQAGVSDICQPFLGDVWAMGLLFYCMVTGVQYPFLETEMVQGGMNSLTEFDKHRETEVVKLALPLLRLCIEVDPSKRATMNDLAQLFHVRPS